MLWLEIPGSVCTNMAEKNVLTPCENYPEGSRLTNVETASVSMVSGSAVVSSLLMLQEHSVPTFYSGSVPLPSGAVGPPGQSHSNMFLSHLVNIVQ